MIDFIIVVLEKMETYAVIISIIAKSPHIKNHQILTSAIIKIIIIEIIFLFFSNLNIYTVKFTVICFAIILRAGIVFPQKFPFFPKLQ